MYKISNFLEQHRGKRVYIATHSRADPDAISSAYALKKFLNKLGYRKIQILVPEGLSTKTNNLLKKLSIKIRYYVDTPETTDNDVFIVVDTADTNLLSDLKSLISGIDMERILWIDHHLGNKSLVNEMKYVYIDTNASSTLEIILDLIALYFPIHRIFNKKELRFLTVSLYIETKGGGIASSRGMYWLSNLTKILGLRLENLKKYIPKAEKEVPEKMALIKSVIRSRWFKFGDKYVSITYISSYQNIVSSLHLRIGADISIVYSYKKRGKIHFRCTNVEETMEILRNVVEKLLERLKSLKKLGAHGGHASIYNVEITRRVSREEIEKIIFNVLEEVGGYMGKKVEEILK